MINNGVDHKRIFENEFVNFDGWVKGRIIPAEQKQIMADDRKVLRNPVTGRFYKEI